jgi:hypothetical protein
MKTEIKIMMRARIYEFEFVSEFYFKREHCTMNAY